MNEQIKKIADEAKKFHYQSLAPATHSLPVSKVKELANQANAAGIEIISDGFCEKFAELIVYDFLSELTNDDALGAARIATIKRLAEKWGIRK